MLLTIRSTMFGWFSSKRIEISRIELTGIPSRSFSILTFFRATMLSSSISRALLNGYIHIASTPKMLHSQLLHCNIFGRNVTKSVTNCTQLLQLNCYNHVPVNNSIRSLSNSIEFFKLCYTSYVVGNQNSAVK